MKFIATFRNSRYDKDRKYSIVAEDLFEADERAQKMAKKERWLYISITPASTEWQNEVGKGQKAPLIWWKGEQNETKI